MDHFQTHPINETIDLWYPIQNIYSRFGKQVSTVEQNLLIGFGCPECCVKDSEVTSVMNGKEFCQQT